MMRTISTLLLAFAALVFAAGCSINLPGSGPAPDLFVLTPKSTFDQNLPTVTWQLVIEEPVASNGLNTTGIAVAKSATELDYLPGARWAERAPAMVQTLLVESFENSNRIVSVGRQSIGLRSDYLLKPELREFQVEYPQGKPEVRVRVNAKLVNQQRRAIVASQSFEYLIPATSATHKDLVLAFDEGLGKTMRRIVEWTLVNAK